MWKEFFFNKNKEKFLHYCNFSNLNLKKAAFLDSTLKECHFTEACLIEADFHNTDLSGSIFHSTDLFKADFSGAKNYEIDLRVNKVKKAKFSFPEALQLLLGFEIEIV